MNSITVLNSLACILWIFGCVIVSRHKSSAYFLLVEFTVVKSTDVEIDVNSTFINSTSFGSIFIKLAHFLTNF